MKFLALVLVILSLAACGESPTAPSPESTGPNYSTYAMASD